MSTKRTSPSPKRRAPARAPSKPKKVAVPPGQSAWMLDVPFQMRSVAQYAGAKWDEERRCWLYVGFHLPDALIPFAPVRHSWPAWQQHDLLASLGVDTTESPVSSSGVTLRSHQIEAVDAILDARASGLPGFILADDLGLGKTYTAIEAIRRMDDIEHVLVVSPVAVLPGFRRSIDALGDAGKRWCAINYESLRKLVSVPKSAHDAKRTRTKNKRIAEKGQPLVRWDAVLFDESHRLKNVTTQQSKLARTLAANAKFVVWMSATAGQNPLELAYLAPLLGAVTGHEVKDLEAFEAWCSDIGLSIERGDFGKWTWKANPEDIERVHAMLFKPSRQYPTAGIRRLPTDVSGWQEIQRIPTPVDLDADATRLYHRAWEQFRDEMQMRRTGRDSSSALVAQLRFRQKSSILRVGTTVAMIQDLLSNGRQVAVSVEFHETLDAITEKLHASKIPTAAIHGKMSAAEKETQRLAFQQGHAQVVLFTPCEGINLHQNEQAVNGTDAPRALVIHDLRWSAIAMAQIEGRTHRDGQVAPAYWMFAADTHDEKIMRVVLERTVAMKSMVGDDTDDLEAIHAALFGD